MVANSSFLTSVSTDTPGTATITVSDLFIHDPYPPSQVADNFHSVAVSPSLCSDVHLHTVTQWHVHKQLNKKQMRLDNFCIPETSPQQVPILPTRKTIPAGQVSNHSGFPGHPGHRMFTEFSVYHWTILTNILTKLASARASIVRLSIRNFTHI